MSPIKRFKSAFGDDLRTLGITLFIFAECHVGESETMSLIFFLVAISLFVSGHVMRIKED